MGNIIIVECISTGVNYIADIKNRNHNPVVMNTRLNESGETEMYEKMRRDSLDRLEDVEIIHEKDTYDETLQMVKGYEPLLIIPGSERGIKLACRLSHNLGLPGNPIENVDACIMKDLMQEKLAEKGLRHIRGLTVTSADEAIEFYESEGLSDVVVKPVYSAGSVGVKMCSGKEELVSAFDELLGEANLYGDDIQEFVVQERIFGNEHIVNTASCNGVHRITTIWEHKKTETPSGDYVFDYTRTINELNLGQADLIEYAFDVLDALGIRYGGVHAEYSVDEKGPVLIEVNCRPMGSSLDAEFMDRISGQHETDSILDSYLNPEKFNYQKDRGYRLYEHGALKYLVVPKDVVAESSPMRFISNNLKSHYKTSQELIASPKTFVKTENLETTGGTIYLSHPDGYTLQKDIDFLKSIEKYAFQLVLSNPSDNKVTLDENESYEDVLTILERIRAYEPILLVTDHVFDDVGSLQVAPSEIDSVTSEFDCVVVNLNRSIIDERDDLVAQMMLKIIGKVKAGGLILIPKSTYQYMPNGRIGVEALIKALDLKLEMPIYDLKGCAIASKR